MVPRVIKTFYTMIGRLVMSYFTVLRWNPVKLISETSADDGWLYAGMQRHSCIAAVLVICPVTVGTEPKMRPVPAEADGTRPGSGRILSLSGRASLGLTGMGFRPGHRGSMIKNELCIFIAALCNRTGHYIFVLWFLLLSSIFFSSPNLSRRRLDVYNTSTHGMAVVRI